MTNVEASEVKAPVLASVRRDDPDFSGKTCFIIMPYGKSGAPGPGGAPDERQHFDAVYKLIGDTVTSLGIQPLRSDRRHEAVPIHSRMLADIIDADLAIVDITNHNPNVFYELGVRHTARRNATLLLGAEGTRPPFNITGIRVIHYDLSTDATREDTSKRLRDAIVANLSSRVTDSLVHSLLPGLNVTRPQERLKHDREPIAATFKPPPKPGATDVAAKTFRLGVIKGDLVDVDIVDVWVNPENTRMEMARIHDDSVSAFIRFHGARKDRQGNVVEDTISKQLSRYVDNKHVEAGWVVVTGPGALRDMNVRAVFHVATQHGEPCNGYHTIKTYKSVVSNALEKLDQINASWWRRWYLLGSARPLRSIIFPLLGTNARDLDPIEVTEDLVREARKYLTLWPETQITSIYFLAYTKRDLELCEAAFARLGMKLEPTSTVRRAP